MTGSTGRRANGSIRRVAHDECRHLRSQTADRVGLSWHIKGVWPHLRLTSNEEPKIVDTLLQGFIGDAIDDNCPTIEARKLRALGELNKLRDYALSQGYTASEVRAFVTSKEEKAKGKAMAAAWLKERGAEPGNPDAYCKIGEEEIAKESLIGYLLRSTK
jgi:hypothetical protein